MLLTAGYRKKLSEQAKDNKSLIYQCVIGMNGQEAIEQN
jgi:hypothetical protein